ncbi:Dehydrin COR47 [Striga hermonthica]|uniref:Dehydrin COR47 n=1 Tax=Striga hermonthica TaxID=68872 RepID=A0A9N7R5Y6_STRHE|nr:Dehydrin COR47 [Striga hermonthica]
MVDELHQYLHGESEISDAPSATAADRGLLDVVGKNDEEEKKKSDEGALTEEFEDKVEISSENKVEEVKRMNEAIVKKLHRSTSSGSSSGEEEVDDCREKKNKNKGLKEKIVEKVLGENKQEEEIVTEVINEDTLIPIENIDDHHIPTQEENSVLDKIREKLPGGNETEEVAAPPPTPAAGAVYAAISEADNQENKGLLDKINKKLPI